MTKVLYVNHSASLDGATQVLVNLIGSLDSASIDPLVLLPYDGPIIERLNTGRIPHQIISVGHSRWDMYHVPLLHMLFREQKCDIVHANTLLCFPAIIAANLYGIPVIWHIHEMISHLEYYTRSFDAMDEKFFAKLVAAADRICTASDASREAFVAYCDQRQIAVAEKAMTIHNGVVLPPSAPIEKTPGKRVITGIGNMVAVKGWKYLVEAFADLCPAHPDLELQIVGKVYPGYFLDIYKPAEARGVADKVKFLTETTDIDAVYRRSDIIVCSSLMETFPMVVLEAMSYAKPIVATDVGGIREMIADRDTGLLVPPADAAALAEGIRHYLDDWDKATAIGKRAQEKAKAQFSVVKQSGEFTRLYEELARSGHDRAHDPWAIEEIKDIFFKHMIAESEKVSRLESNFENLLENLNAQQQDTAARQRGTAASLQQFEQFTNERLSNIIDDVRTLEGVVENLLNQWPLRLMRRLKGLWSRR
jgi:glycosyltransferase involved in cell wall biosynthesis